MTTNWQMKCIFASILMKFKLCNYLQTKAINFLV